MFNYHDQLAPGEGQAFVYRSSAGSGKTFALTKAYLKLVLLDTSRYHQVLAITFTNDAKDEMKNRILAELTLLAKGENSTMRQAILKDFAAEKVVNIEGVLTSRAQTVLNALLHDYSRFNVSTIDHFFAQLIRHLAKELNLNLGYELDIDSQRALNEAVAMLFTAPGKKLLAWLQEFSLARLEDDKGWDISGNIAALGKKLFQESYLDIEETLAQNTGKLEAFIGQLRQTVSRFKRAVTKAAGEAIAIAHTHGLEEKDFSRGIPYRVLANMANSEYDYSKQPSDSFLNATTLEKWHTKTSAKVETISRARDAGMGAAHAKIRALYTGNDYRQYLEARAILSYIHAYGVLASLSEKLHEYRSSHNLILISDTAFILNKVIKGSEFPFIYEKIGARYNYILIDEFQDTSYYQWQGLLPFFTNALADGGQLFIVGDVKQSIYSWRGGDMKLLLHQVEKDIAIPAENIRTLGTNYRSARNIIAFNNAFFQLAPAQLAGLLGLEPFLPDLEKAYQDVRQQPTKEFDGYVQVRFFGGTEDRKWQEEAEEAVLAAIREAGEAGFALSDMLILTRKTDEASRMARFLLDRGINTISEEALLVTSSPKVQLLISTLKYLYNKHDFLAITEFNYFYQQVFGLPVVVSATVPELLLAAATRPIATVYELVEELIILLGLPGSEDIYLQQLLDICFTQTKKGNSTLPLFLSWWQEEITNQNAREMAINLPENEESVKVMTIHKAKGLEYPVVFLPYTDNSLTPMTNSIFWARPLPPAYQSWGSLPLKFVNHLAETSFREVYYDEFFKVSLEALNLHYVAFTRAVERLYIFANARSRAGNSGSLLAAVLQHPEFDLRAGYDDQTMTFVLGEPAPKVTARAKQQIPAGPLTVGASPLPEKIKAGQQQNKRYLAFNNARVKEGLALHKALAMMSGRDTLDETLRKMLLAQLIREEEVPVLSEKLTRLFDKIPELTDWFDGGYEVMSERPVWVGGQKFIPDRVMIKEGRAIIVDYKREKRSPQHQHQVKQYGELLRAMGYAPVAMYLLYIDDQRLVEVKAHE